MSNQSSKHGQTNYMKRGRRACKSYLERRGYDVLKCNWKCSAGKIDVIALEYDTLVFVEVKMNINIEDGLPIPMVTASKRDRYERITAQFLRKHGDVDLRVRFDSFSILMVGKRRAFIKHCIDFFR